MSAIQRRRVELAVDDGTKMSAYVAEPTSQGPKPGMLVFQEAYGVNAHIRDVAERFALAGFVSIAPELFHRTAPGFEGKYGDFAATREHTQALTTEGLEADARAAYGWLNSESRVKAEQTASVGFCMGGLVSYLANATLPLSAAISFYGGGIAPDLLDRAAQQHGPILMFWGGRDQHILPEHYRAVADALSAAGKPHEQVVFSFADHGFFNDARQAYDEDAARQAWVLCIEFLRANGVLDPLSLEGPAGRHRA